MYKYNVKAKIITSLQSLIVQFFSLSVLPIISVGVFLPLSFCSLSTSHCTNSSSSSCVSLFFPWLHRSTVFFCFFFTFLHHHDNPTQNIATGFIYLGICYSAPYCDYMFMYLLVSLVCASATSCLIVFLLVLWWESVCVCVCALSGLNTPWASMALERQMTPLPFASMLSALQGTFANWLTPLRLLISISLFRYTHTHKHI